MAINKKSDTESKWYLVFGSGPHGDGSGPHEEEGIKGESDQPARVSVLPLNDLIVGNLPAKGMRIAKGWPDTTPPNSYPYFIPYAGTFQLPDETTTLNGFVSEPITVDFDVNPSNNGKYASDAIYFGTVEGYFDTGADGTPYWKGGGHLYRLAMNPSGHIVGTDDDVTPDTWGVKPLLDLSGKVDRLIPPSWSATSSAIPSSRLPPHPL